VEKTGELCFYVCELLSEVRFEPNSQDIRDYAFSDSGVQGFRIASTVERIGESGFFGCTLLAAVRFSTHSNLEILNRKIDVRMPEDICH
jgi:hypothetical protein